ncbi:MAG TPA: efflux RND transporter periplasmic adaptor subunit [Gemmatimonadaceae bacterium]|nr:efflux RND transporter periplasmic adaptor subunit [Gemmatimonadaceae bacterium]
MQRFSLFAASVALATLAACKGGDGADGAGDSTSTSGTSADTAAAGSSSSMVLPVTAEAAIDGDLIISLVTRGLVRSESETRLKAEVGGTVEAILARPGDRVKKGQPIIRLAQYEFDFAVRQAEAQVAEATGRFREEWVPDSAVTGNAPTPERLERARVRSGLKTAELSLERAKWERERSTVKAPFDGIIDQIDVSMGERIGASQQVTMIVDATNLRIEAAVLEHDIQLVRVGGDAAVSTAAAPNRVSEGKIVAVLPIIDSVSRSGRAYVRVRGTDVLRPGMYADVKLEAQRLTKRRLVPATAVIQRDGRPLVFVVKNGRAQWVYIVPGRSNGLWTEVLPDTSGQNVGQIPVQPGDQIVVQGQLTLTHDAPVRVVARRETEARQ